MTDLATDDYLKQIEERDQLVAALTLQLEQAAEQLDRYHRQGAASKSASRQSVSSSHVSQQEELIQQVEQLNQSWDDFALGGSMGRVELQLNEIRDLFYEHIVNAKVSFAPPSIQTTEIEEQSAETPISGEQELSSVLEAFGDFYESNRETHDEENEDSENQKSSDFENAPTPSEIDVETASHDELIDAIHQRDLFIGYLIRRQRELTAERILSVPTDWEALNNAPDKLSQQLQTLESQLTEQLRLAEVKFSIERGRLAREQAEIDQLRLQLEKQAKSLGLSIEAARKVGHKDKSTNQNTNGNKPAKTGRWRNYLGIDNS